MSECLRRRLYVNTDQVSKRCGQSSARLTSLNVSGRTQQWRAGYSAQKVSSQSRMQHASTRHVPEHSGTLSARAEILPSISRADTTSLIDIKGCRQRGQGVAGERVRRRERETRAAFEMELVSTSQIPFKGTCDGTCSLRITKTRRQTDPSVRGLSIRKRCAKASSGIPGC